MTYGSRSMRPNRSPRSTVPRRCRSISPDGPGPRSCIVWRTAAVPAWVHTRICSMPRAAPQRALYRRRSYTGQSRIGFLILQQGARHLLWSSFRLDEFELNCGQWNS